MSPDENRKLRSFFQDSFFFLSSHFLCGGFSSIFVEILNSVLSNDKKRDVVL
jgi:hypothetical protein